MKVKKEIRSYTVVNNRQVFMLPKIAKVLYHLSIKKMDERPYVERYWNTIIPDKLEWHDIWHARIAMQGEKNN